MRHGRGGVAGMRSQGRILLFTGDGKGKTTAALGMALRACGHGQKTLIIQFIKSDASTGEIEGLKHLPCAEIIQKGLGFVPPESDQAFETHRQAAQEGLSSSADALASGRYDLVILDEVCLAVSRHLLEEDAVMEVIQKARPQTCVVMTGREASPGLIALADTVTEMHMVKHGLATGIKAQKGVEY
jgi:cob(I)alamin adenosyltransferase